MAGVSRTKGTRLVVLVIATITVVFACGGIDSEEMKCEEAALRVANCCEKIDVNRINCVDEPPGCGTFSRVPAFTDAASECIFDRTCGDLQERGICDGIRALTYGRQYPQQAVDQPFFQREACR